MTPQMKNLLKYSCGIYCIVALGLSIFLVSVGFAEVSVLFYVFYSVDVLLSIFSFIWLKQVDKEDKLFASKVALAKHMLALRDKAILNFYLKNKITPLYDKNGKIIPPDEYLGILTMLDENGNLLPTVYEMLGILPQFSVDGKEKPFIFVLKNLTKSFKSKDLQKVSDRVFMNKATPKQKVAEKKAKAPAKKAGKEKPFMVKSTMVDYFNYNYKAKKFSTSKAIRPDLEKTSIKIPEGGVGNAGVKIQNLRNEQKNIDNTQKNANNIPGDKVKEPSKVSINTEPRNLVGEIKSGEQEESWL